MAKLRKKLSAEETEKSKVVNGKVTKVKKLTEVPQTRKLQVKKLDSPARSQQRNFENSVSATPFSTNSMLKFTSTPMNVEHNRQNVRLSLKKLPSRLPLSPIHSNICNTKQEDETTRQKRIEKGGNVKAPKNLPKSEMRGSRANNENENPSIRIGTRRKSVGVQRIAPVSENAESRCSRLRVRLRKLDSSIESLSSDSHSSKRSSKKTLQKHATNQKNVPARSYVFSDSSASPNSRTRHRKAAEELPPNSGKNHTMVKRLRSDWSSTTLGEETLAPSVVQKQYMTSKAKELHDTRQMYKQNNCSKLRVRLRRSTLDCTSPSPPIDLISKRRKSCHDNSLVKHLQSDWTNTTLEETPTQNRTPKDNQIQRKQANKRRLTPLVEMSVENTTIPPHTFTATPTVVTKTKNNNEDGYSSSAEFQSDDEVSQQNRSKRAPTWKDLLNKTNESPLVVKKNAKLRVPVIKLKRSQKLASKINIGPALEKGDQKSQQKQKHIAVGDNCPVDSAIEVEKASRIDKEKIGPTGKKEENNFVVEVSNDLALKESHEIEKKNKVSAQPHVSVPEKISASSSTQHNNSQTNTNTSPRCHETANNEIIDLTCPVKFFHSRLENTVSVAKPKEGLKRRRSSRRKKQESVYEFLSQSSSESNKPVDDVIQKMIQTGKVVVAKHKKGTGKNTLPRKKSERTRKKKITKTQDIPIKQTKPLTEKPFAREKLQEDLDDGLHFDDGFHFDDGESEIPDEEHVRDQRGFSNLARSAMIKQAGRIQKPSQRKPITDKKKLLAMALKFVNQSTPVRMTPNTISAPQFSPMSGNKSPWRVDDDKLPNLFYLGRDSDNLPSFSSDYIPMTPTKNKSKSISSFSSNDSNGENTAPPGAKIITNEANMQALTNTRKALSYRSPLKAINVLEVVNLPPLALHSYGKKSNDENTPNNNLKETALSSTHKRTSNIFENISNNNSNNNSNPNSNHSKSDVSNENADNQFESTQNQNVRKSTSDASNDNATDLFGFEELIEDENSFPNVTIDKTILPNKDALKERLQRLKQLRPNKPVVVPNKTKRIEPVFDNVRPKQKTLKQMLCSTMIDNQHHHDVRNHSFNDTEDLSNLFKDLEPETTFDDSLPRRTYNRPFKRKRKMLSNLATIMDSDVSEDEEEAIKRPIKNYKAKPKKRQKINPELNKFVNDFNEMCKEVSQYELIVE